MERRTPLWGWTSRLSSRRADLLIAGFLTLFGLISSAPDPFVRHSLSGAQGKLLLALGLTLLQTVPLYWRRRLPSVVLLLVAAAFAAKTLLSINATIAAVGLLISVYSVAAYGADRRRLWALLAAGLVFLSGFVLYAVSGNPHFLAVCLPGVAFVAAWLIGDYLGTRRAHVAALEERAGRLERERHLDRQVAADEERARIARELHDVVAHDVSVIAIQAGAARTVQQAQPEAAAEALALIETTARKTLTELSQLLGVLRRVDGQAAQRAPQPGLAQIGTLLDELRAAGLQVDYYVEGEQRALPATLDLSAYRILQESATNVLKHAGARRVEIVVSYQPNQLVLSVRDDGQGPAGTGVASGHGLVGMRERAALFHGQVRAGPLKSGGYEVAATLPFESGG